MMQCSHTEMEELDADRKILEKDVSIRFVFVFLLTRCSKKRVGTFVLHYLALYLVYIVHYCAQRGTVQNSTSRIRHSSFVTK